MTSNQKYSEHYFSANDGVKLYARKYGWENTDPYPIVCLADISGNSKIYHTLAMFLSSKAGGARRVVTFDARGRGRSEKGLSSADYNLMTEASDVLSVVTAAGLQHINLIGTARGGLLAMVLAGQRPGILNRLILSEAAPRLEGQEVVRQKQLLINQKAVGSWSAAAQFLKDYMGPFFPALGEADWSQEAEARYTEQKGKIVPQFDPAILNSIKNINLDVRLGEMWSEFRGLCSIPTALIHAENSEMISNETLENMKAIKPDLVVIEAIGQGHSPLLHIDELPKSIASFLTNSS